MKRCPLCARSYPDSERFCSEHALPLQPEPTLDGRPRGELTGHVLDGRYQLGGVLGSGGMGTVYDSLNLRITCRCAVKVLLPELVRDVKMRQRLFREIAAASQLQHPNVVRIIDYGDDERAGAYLVMEYLEGRALDEVIGAHGALSLGITLKVATQIASALEAIHDHGLVHCDLKPANVFLLPSGDAKVLDFGLVKPYDPQSAEFFLKITSRGMTFGTPQYMSPEQASFNPVDPRTDIYSLGVLLFEALVGRPPFDGGSPMEVIEAHRSRQVPMPSRVNPGIVLPGALEVLLLGMLHKDPARRPGTAGDVLETLRTIAAEQEVNLAAMDLAPVARGEAPAAEPTRPVDLTLPLPAPPTDMERVLERVIQRRGAVIDRAIHDLKLSIPRYQAVDHDALSRHFEIWVEVLLEQLSPNPPAGLPPAILDIIMEREQSDFTPAELLAGFWIAVWSCRPVLLEVAGKDLELYRSIVDRVDYGVLPFYLELAQQYMAQFTRKLERTNELLSRQNNELLQLRAQLDEQLRRTHAELVEAERVKARVADAISSGLVLVQRDSQRVVLFNRALEQLTGLAASEVVGRPIDEIFHLVEGVPFDEFVEQVRHHGHVGLRKLRVRLPSGRERTIYVRGQPYPDENQPTGVLFTVEDVTEREKIIESFSRYVSREVAQKIMRGGGSMRATGEPREAALLAVGIRSFEALLPRLGADEVVELLDGYIRAVGSAVSHHGGVVDTVVGGSVLVYFSGRGVDAAAPVRAATEIVRRVELLSERREREGRAPVQVGQGVHLGQVLLVNVGGRRRMVHTVLGEPADVARRLQRAATGGEILVTPAVAGALGDGIATEPALPVDGGDRTAAIAARRVVIPPEEAAEELDPPTLT